MKKWMMLTLMFAFTAAVSRGQSPVVRKGATETATIKVPTVQCEQCKNRIEKYLSAEEGVQKVTVDYKRKTAKVVWLWDRTNVENVKTAIANAGYDADDVTANAESYQKLPTCCKKPEDGGGPEKK